MSTEIQKIENESQSLTVFSGSQEMFERAQRMANALCSSDLVPTNYQGKDKIGNTMIALDLAMRINMSPLMVMQNLYIVHGKPSWSGQFIIASINATGKFSPLRFREFGEKGTDSWGFVAYAIENSTGEKLEGAPIDMAMVKAEGWMAKNGSKWKTMPELMFRYRAATFFGRLYCPEILMGMRVEGEVEDITYEEVKSVKTEEVADTVFTPINVEPAPEPAKSVEGWKEMVELFKKHKIKEYALLSHIGKDDSLQVTLDDLSMLMEILKSITDGTMTKEKFFENPGKTKDEILFGGAE